MKARPIGVFDSGYGGLTVLKEIISELPGYDYLYLGDNARAPYGTRNYETVYNYTRQCIKWFFDQDCPLVILACNTASAKALRTIQQNDLPGWGEEKRVLGVIRPTSEVIGNYSKSGHVGIFATNGTVQSGSYPIEIANFNPTVKVSQEACPMWVPLIENNEFEGPGADHFIKKHINNLLHKDPLIDTILLGCTHYPLMIRKISEFLPSGIRLIQQGEIVAKSLADYLKRHPSIDNACSKEGKRHFFSTGETADFSDHASLFFGEKIEVTRTDLV